MRFRSGEIRIGRILQAMDSIAGLVGYRHCFGSVSQTNPFVLVTACVDSIKDGFPVSPGIVDKRAALGSAERGFYGGVQL